MKKYSNQFYRELCHEGFSGQENPKDKLDLDRWTPSAEDEKLIKQFLLESYWDVLDMCGEDEAREYIDLFHEIEARGIVRCREKVQDEFLLAFWAVDGEVEEYYRDSPEMLALIQLTILKPLPL